MREVVKISSAQAPRCSYPRALSKMSTRPRKKAKKSGESAFSQSVLESLNCSITAALPVVPVLAENGRIYERAAIKRWLSEKARSPLTNATMGKHLADASGTTRPSLMT